MQLSYAIAYVPDVSATLAFYEAAFGLERRFLHENGLYGELVTGQTTLAFAAESMAEDADLAIRPLRPSDVAPGVEIAFATPSPADAFARAIAAGARAVKPPEQKPWGQVVAYVRDLNGLLVEICTPM